MTHPPPLPQPDEGPCPTCGQWQRAPWPTACDGCGGRWGADHLPIPLDRNRLCPACVAKTQEPKP